MSRAEPPSVVNSRRRDALEKVTGHALFAGDIHLPGMVHAEVIRSARPHAFITDVDTETAEGSAGVVCVVTASDLQSLDDLYGHVVIDRPILAGTVTRFVGEPIAIVVAESQLKARAAAQKVRVSYEDIDAVFDPREAMQGRVALHHDVPRPGLISSLRVDSDLSRNICHRASVQRGSLGDAMRSASLVLKGTYTFPSVYQFSLEPHVALASFVDADLTVWSCAQHPFAIRRELARIFGLRLNQVSVSVPYIGGGFGGKSWTKVEPLASVASWISGRPVRLALDTAGAMHTTRRHSAEVTVETGFAGDGRILARKVRGLYDNGAYTDNGPTVVKSSVMPAIAPYSIGAYDVECLAVFTNKVPSGSMRSIGGPQMNWAVESQMDEAARELGVDPMALRERNFASEGDEIFDGMTPVDVRLQDSSEKLKAVCPPHEALADVAMIGSGRGFAAAMTSAGGVPTTGAWVRLHADGSVTLHVGSTEMGQGSKTVLSLIVSRALDVPEHAVNIVMSDTRQTPYDHSTGASRTTTVTGSAVLAASEDLTSQLRSIASEFADVPEEHIELTAGHACWRGGAASYEELVSFWFGSPGAGELVGRGYSGRRVPGNPFRTRPIFWETSMGMADVRVDIDTGEVEVERFVVVSDVGLPLNPELVKGQEEGAVVMGLGHTLFESLYPSGSTNLDPSLSTYRVPMAGDRPDELITGHVANEDGPGPFGSRGVGEGAIVHVGAAIGNAVRRAAGIEIRHLPMTPESVWRAIRGANETKLYRG